MGNLPTGCIWEVFEEPGAESVVASTKVQAVPESFSPQIDQLGEAFPGYCFYMQTPKGNSYITARIGDQPVLVAISKDQAKQWGMIVALPCIFKCSRKVYTDAHSRGSEPKTAVGSVYP